MKRRVAILTEIIAPYRIPVFNALAARPDVELHVIFLAETDPDLRQWRIYRDEIRFSYEVLQSRRLRIARKQVLVTRGMRLALDRWNPDSIVAGGYNYVATWQAQRWARTHGVPFLLWSESNAADARNQRWLVEAAKRKFVRRCQGYVVPGQSAAEYLKALGVPAEQIFTAPNAVDTHRFGKAGEAARTAPDLRCHLGLPDRYFLYAGRFVRAKGVFDLLAAYAKLPEDVRRDVGMVLAGDGEERGELLRRSREIRPGTVQFPGFQDRDELPPLYALAEGLILPTHSDTWGLVVNEAIACGAAVIVSRVAGCVADLVQDGKNGFVVEPGDSEELSRAMLKLAQNPELKQSLGRQSLEISSRFTPEAWAEGLAGAVRSVRG